MTINGQAAAGHAAAEFDFMAVATNAACVLEIDVVVRLQRPATLEDLEAAGFDCRPATPSELIGIGLVHIDECPEHLRGAIRQHLARGGQ